MILLNVLSYLKEILATEYGSFGFVVVFSTFVIYLAFNFGSFKERFKSVNFINNAIDKIREDISAIKGTIEVFKLTNNPFAKAQSPVNLTEAGLEVSNVLRAKEAINLNWDKILTAIKKRIKEEDKKEECNPYTIQQICFDIGSKYSTFFTDKEMNTIKTYAYEQGHNLNMYDIIFGIEIRNKYFEENKLDIEEVDNHDPTQKSTSP